MQTEIYTRRDRQTETSLRIGGWSTFLALVIVAMVLLTGCTSYTVLKLTSMCHAEQRSPSSSFNGDAGRVDCK